MQGLMAPSRRLQLPGRDFLFDPVRKIGDPSGLPSSGLVGLWDPYRDVYGRNVLPVGAEDFATGWLALGSATVTVTPNQPDPDGGNNAYRIQTSGGSLAQKYQAGLTHVVGVSHVIVLQIKVNAGSCVLKNMGSDGTTTVTSSSWANASVIGVTQYTSGGLQFRGVTAGNDLDITVYHPQLNLGPQLFPYSAPAGAPGTLQTGTDYSGHGNTLTYGATTGASTDDPTNTGTAWSFDGGDFLTAGRPAPLEVAQPFCGYVVVKSGVDGTFMPVITKHNASNSGAGNKGAMLTRHTADYLFYVWDGSGTIATVASANNAGLVATGYNGVFFGWDGTQIRIAVNGIESTPVACATHAPDTANPLTLGKYAYNNDYYYTGDIALTAMWAGVCWPVNVSTQIHSYAKSLMAGRGVTVA